MMTTPATTTDAAPAAPVSQRLQEAEERLSKDEWDVDAWGSILHEASSRPYSEAEELYVRLVAQFPPTARYWLARAEHCARDASTSAVNATASTSATEEVVPLGAVLGDGAPVSADNGASANSESAAPVANDGVQGAATNAPEVDQVIATFEAGVKDAPTSVELWRAYIAHVLLRAATGTENAVVAIFERAVNAAGLDLHSTALWQDYIDFLKTRASLSDSQRRDALRRVYQRSVMTLHPFFELLAKGRRLGKLLKFGTEAILCTTEIVVCVPVQNLEGFWRDYTAFEQKANTNKEIGRVLLAEYQPKNVGARTEFRARKGRREGLALTALPLPPRGRAKEASQAAQWRRFITQERANPSTLSADELYARVVHAFESALVPLYRYPDMWIEYLAYLHSALLPPVEVPLAAGPTIAAKPAAQDPAKVTNAVTMLTPVVARAIRAVPACVALHMHISGLWLRLNEPAKAVSVLDTLCRTHSSPLAYVHLMRVARRVDGRDAARKVFARARKDPKGADPAVYVAAATMEFCVNKDSKVARNVFEFGLKKFADSAVMANAFVEWLWGLGDFEYMRVVFEKVMPKVKGASDIVRALWTLWIQVEEVLSDPASVDRVEAMWKESGGVGRPVGVVNNVLRRCRFLTFEGMNEDELAAVGVSQTKPTSGGAAASSTGKRDPRTGRRVSSAMGGSGNESGGNSQTHKSGSTNAGSKPTIVQLANESLMRLGAALGHVAGPPPAVEFIISLVLKTPENFAHTPAGGAMAPAAPNGAPTGPPHVVDDAQSMGKKRKQDEISPALAMSGAPDPTTAPPIDVFRSRQAAKQSRLR